MSKNRLHIKSRYLQRIKNYHQSISLSQHSDKPGAKRFWQALNHQFDLVDQKIQRLTSFNRLFVWLAVRSYKKRVKKINHSLNLHQAERNKIEALGHKFSTFAHLQQNNLDESHFRSWKAMADEEVRRSLVVMDDNLYKLVDTKTPWKRSLYKDAMGLQQTILGHLKRVKKNYSGKVLRAQSSSLQQQELQAREMAQARIEEMAELKARDMLSERLSEQYNQIRTVFIAKQDHVIEEEVNRRLQEEFRLTIKRREQEIKTELELNNQRFSNRLDQMHAEYKALITKMEAAHSDKEKLLMEESKLLRQALVDMEQMHERIFTEKYGAEIERRAKQMAEELLQSEFPFQ